MRICKRREGKKYSLTKSLTFCDGYCCVSNFGFADHRYGLRQMERSYICSSKKHATSLVFQYASLRKVHSTLFPLHFSEYINNKY